MKPQINVFSIPKAGSTPEEYEDAFSQTPAVAPETSFIRLAVADGATETSFSKLWAELLVNAFGQSAFSNSTLDDDIRPLRSQWTQQVGEKDLPWYAEAKMRSGAFAAFAGLTLNSDMSWSGIAVGDSCVFQVREMELLSRFPIERSEQFANRPVLISSNPSSTLEVEAHVVRKTGKWESGDIFYLMTDAVACYFLRRWESRDGDPFVLSLFDDVGETKKFAEFVRRERNEFLPDGSQLMRNDDVTVIRCKIMD